MKASLDIEEQHYTLQLGQIYLIGRNNNGQHKLEIQLLDTSIDDKHAVLEFYNGAVCLIDLHSSNGCYVDGERIQPITRVNISTNATLRLGNVEGNLQIASTTEESHNSSGFHDGFKNISDIICSSPEPDSSSGEMRLKRGNFNFLIPDVPNKANDTITDDYKKNDSFEIPGTQNLFEFPVDEENQSVIKNDCSLASVSIQNSIGNDDVDDDDDDCCIPETQEMGAFAIKNNQELDNQKVTPLSTLEEHPTTELFADDSILGTSSQFRICTQDFNEVNELSRDSTSSDIVSNSLIIPRINHEPIPLVVDVNNDNGNEVDDLFDLVDLNSKQTNEDDKSDNNRDNTCTPDLFDLPDLAQANAKQTENELCDRSVTCTPDLFDIPLLNVSSKNTTDSSIVLPDEIALKQAELDLQPTQMFSVNSKKSELVDEKIDAKPIDVVTNSILPRAAKIPVILDEYDLQPTQVFTLSTNKPAIVEDKIDILPTQMFQFSTNDNEAIENEHDMLPTELFAPEKDKFAPIHVASSDKENMVPSANKATIVCAPAELIEDDIDILPTQLFVPNNSIQMPIQIDMNSTLNCNEVTKQSDKFIIPAAAAVRKTNSLESTNSQTMLDAQSESELDMLMCTPQIIKSNFVPSILEHIPKTTLFTEEPKEDDDVFTLLSKPKETNDFHKLLPHVETTQVKVDENKEAIKRDKIRKAFGDNKNTTSKDQSKPENAAVKQAIGRKLRAAKREQAKPEIEPPQKTKKSDKVTKRPNTKREHAKQEIDQYEPPQKAKRADERTVHSEFENINNLKEVRIILKRDMTQMPEKISTTSMPEKEEVEAALRSNTSKSESKKKEKVKMSNDEETKNKPGKNREKTKKPVNATEKASSSKSKSQNANTEKRRNAITEGAPVVQDINQNLKKNRVTRLRTKSVMVDAGIEEQQKKLDEKKEKVNKKSQKSENCSQSITYDSSSTNKNISDSQSTTSVKRTRRSSTKQDEPKKQSEQNNIINANVVATGQIRQLKVASTMVNHELIQKLKQNSSDIWTLVDDPIECDVLIMDTGNRTFKFLLAMARGIPILRSKWLESINETKTISKNSIYSFKEASFEKRYKFNIMKSLDMARKQKIFKDCHFLMTTNISPNPSEMKVLITCAGGTVLDAMPTHKPKNIYLISSAKDQKDWHKYRRENENLITISTDGVMLAIMRQDIAPLKTNQLL